MFIYLLAYFISYQHKAYEAFQAYVHVHNFYTVEGRLIKCL